MSQQLLSTPRPRAIRTPVPLGHRLGCGAIVIHATRFDANLDPIALCYWPAREGQDIPLPWTVWRFTWRPDGQLVESHSGDYFSNLDNAARNYRQRVSTLVGYSVELSADTEIE